MFVAAKTKYYSEGKGGRLHDGMRRRRIKEKDKKEDKVDREEKGVHKNRRRKKRIERWHEGRK